MARGDRDRARGRDEADRRDRDPGARRRRARCSAGRAPRPAARRRHCRERRGRVLVRRQLAAYGELGRRVPGREGRAGGRGRGLARAYGPSIQLVELPGAVGRDRWLYARHRRGAVRRARGRCSGGDAVAARSRSARSPRSSQRSPCSCPPCAATSTRRTSTSGAPWGATTSPSRRDGTSRCSASNVTWYGPLGAMLLVGGLVLAVIAVRRRWIPRLGRAARAGARLLDRDARRAPLLPGRGGPLPHGTGGARRSDVGDRRFAGGRSRGGSSGVAVTAVALAVLNDSKRPSGVALLERPAPASYWSQPRWRAQGDELHVPDLIRFVDERVPPDARARPRDHGRATPAIVFFGRRPRPPPRPARRAGLATRPSATWAFVSPGAASSAAPALCDALAARRGRALGLAGVPPSAGRLLTGGGSRSGWRESNPHN